MLKNYIYKDKDETLRVVLTGATADRKLRSGKCETLHEIKPAEMQDSTSIQFNKWVKLSDLFEVKNPENAND